MLSLHYGDHFGFSVIARMLGLNRRTVTRIVKRRSVKLKREDVRRRSILDPDKARITELLQIDPQMPATVILQRIREDGYLGSDSILKDFVARQREKPVKAREAYLRLSFSPAECAQVDWGEFGNVFGDGVKIC